LRNVVACRNRVGLPLNLAHFSGIGIKLKALIFSAPRTLIPARKALGLVPGLKINFGARLNKIPLFIEALRAVRRKLSKRDLFGSRGPSKLNVRVPLLAHVGNWGIELGNEGIGAICGLIVLLLLKG